MPLRPAVLFMVAQGITSTGGADWIITKLLGTPKDTMLAQVGANCTKQGMGCLAPAAELTPAAEASPAGCCSHWPPHHAAAQPACHTPDCFRLAPQVRMCLVTAVFSSFVNDTPVFCIMLPIVLTW